jgi:hypothetical protein
MGVFKPSLLAIGMIAGAYCASFVLEQLPVLVVIAVRAPSCIIAASVAALTQK